METERERALDDADDILFNLWMKTTYLNECEAWRILYHAWRYIRNQRDQECANGD